MKAISIKLSQGAKPGWAACYPGQGQRRDRGHPRRADRQDGGVAARTQRVQPRPAEFVEFIATLRRLSGGKPIGFKLCIGARTEFLSICKAIVAAGIAPDFVIVDGGEGGTGAARRSSRTTSACR